MLLGANNGKLSGPVKAKGVTFNTITGRLGGSYSPALPWICKPPGKKEMDGFLKKQMGKLFNMVSCPYALPKLRIGYIIIHRRKMELKWTIEILDDGETRVMKGSGSLEDLKSSINEIKSYKDSQKIPLNVRIPVDFINIIKENEYNLTEFTIYSLEKILNLDREYIKPPKRYPKKKVVTIRIPVDLLDRLNELKTTQKKSTIIIRALEIAVENLKN